MKGKVKFLSGDKQLYQKFKLGHVIGTGNSLVYEATNSEGLVECVKEVLLNDNQNEFIFRKEVELLAKLKQHDHPNIVKCRGIYCIQQQKSQYTTIKKGYIQMERGLTNLKTFLSHQKKHFEEEEVLNFMKSMIDVFAHLQKIEIAHRDIKPSNILIFNETPLEVKICDVGAGTAVGYCNTSKESTSTVIGTPYYLSPELYLAYNNKLNNVRNNPYKSDMYSLGLVFLEVCLLQRTPIRFTQESNALQECIQKVKSLYANIIGLGKVLRKMLAYNVSDRQDFIEMSKYIKENDYFRSKINSGAKLSIDLQKVISSNNELQLDNITKLSQIQNLISTGTKIHSLNLSINNMIMGISGTNQELFDEIRKIKYLDLQNLTITVQICGIADREAKVIAEGIEKSKKLTHLNLSLWNNNITNDGLKFILSSVKTVIGSLKSLTIKVSNNKIFIDNSFKDYFDFSQGKLLEKLTIDLSFNTINQQNLQFVCRQLAKSSNLLYLDLQVEKIGTNQTNFKRSIKFLEKLKTIQELIINASCNSIREEGMFALADLVTSLDQLIKYTLIVRNAEVTDKGYSEFMKTITTKNNLKQLKVNLLNNQITQKGTQNSSQYLKAMGNIEIIDFNFSNNKLLGYKGLKNHVKALLEIKTLSKIRLSFDSCGVCQKGCLYLGRMISQLPKLSELDLSLKYNDIQFQGIQYICAGLLKAKKLKKLKLILEGTQVGDYSANYLAKCLLKIKSLTAVDLNLQSCNLSAETMSNILSIVKEYSKVADEITIHMRKNRKINVELYEKIKKQLNDNKIAIKVDNPQSEDTTTNNPFTKTRNNFI